MDVALTSHYRLDFGGLPNPVKGVMSQRGLTPIEIDKISLLCYDAALPATSLATNNIEGNFTGVQQQYAHTRIFPNIDMGFYCDSGYKVLTFFESWIEYISGGGASVDKANPGYFYRMRYPNSYKGNIAIDKFDRDYTQGCRYNFIRMFPVSVSPVPVSYEASQLLRVNVTFNYERYIMTSTFVDRSASSNRTNSANSAPTADELAAALSDQSSFLRGSTDVDISNAGNTNFGAFVNGSPLLDTKKFKDAFSQAALDSWLSAPPAFDPDAPSSQNINFTAEVGGFASGVRGGSDSFGSGGASRSSATPSATTLRRQGRSGGGSQDGFGLSGTAPRGSDRRQQ